MSLIEMVMEWLCAGNVNPAPMQPDSQAGQSRRGEAAHVSRDIGSVPGRAHLSRGHREGWGPPAWPWAPSRGSRG